MPERIPHPLAGQGRSVADAVLRPAAPPTAPAPGMQCVAWKAVNKNTLRGFADLLLPKAGLLLLECAVHEKDGSAWVNPPAKELRDAEGRRTGFRDTVGFVDRDARRAWSDAALAAVQEWRRAHPEDEGQRQAGGGYEW